VSVPVLSVLIAEVDPRVSVDRSCFMMAPARARACVPHARIVVTTVGNCTGTAAIAKATAALNTVLKVRPRARFSAMEAISATPATTRSCFESRSSWRVRGVLTVDCSCSMPEMWPTSVAIPVAVTTSSPAPRVTEVFMYTMSVRSPSGALASATGAVLFETGRLSPVSSDSATSSVIACSSRPSAGTMSPAAIETTSPGTSCSAGISACSPPRRTRAVTIIFFCSSATAASALPSC
jgi:hypothetical protein